MTAALVRTIRFRTPLRAQPEQQVVQGTLIQAIDAKRRPQRTILVTTRLLHGSAGTGRLRISLTRIQARILGNSDTNGQENGRESAERRLLHSETSRMLPIAPTGVKPMRLLQFLIPNPVVHA
jgi:hypothetical protein